MTKDGMRLTPAKKCVQPIDETALHCGIGIQNTCEKIALQTKEHVRGSPSLCVGGDGKTTRIKQ